MRAHTRWFTLYVVVVVILALGAGIVVEHNDAAETTHNTIISSWNDAENPTDVRTSDIRGLRIEDMNYSMRTDLGYPRIERILDSYEETIRRYANRYGFDWRLILAVMNQESRFRIQAVSHRGAYGLMQIMPMTGEEVSAQLGISGISLPEDNIAGGVYYLWRMYTLFHPGDSDTDYDEDIAPDRIRIALAAYNAGPSRIRDAQRLARYLNLDPYSWDIIRNLLPMLSRRHSSLHAYVWEHGRPIGGYFNGYAETINYVDRTMEYYDYYRTIFE